MDISQALEKVRRSQQEFSSAEELQQRCERMFPGVAVKIEYGDNGRASISGLTKEQIKQLMTPWA